MKSLWYCVVRKDFAVPGGFLHITSLRVFLNSWSATPEIQCPVLAGVWGAKPTNIRFCLRNTLNFVCPLNDDLFPLHFQEYALMYILVLPAVEGRKDKVGEWFLSIYSWLCSCFYFNLLLSYLLYYFFKLDSAHSSRDSSWQLLMATVNYEYSLA